jgi:dTDP-4-amino-4,6-dideoxygalactose transaminase
MTEFVCRERYLPFCTPDVSQRELDEVADAVRSGWWAKGPRTLAFERAFAESVGAKFAVGMNSATAALHVSLLAAGIGPGDEVITSPYTFCASANTILHAGATPVFVDIQPDTGCIDPDAVRAAITPRTRAIVPVHYSGMACDLGSLYAIAEKHGLFVSEDAAHSVESKYQGKPIGHAVPGAASFSFYATKNLATGEGGMLVTEDESIARRARVLCSHGMSANAWNRYGKGGAWRYDVEAPGFKYNMFDIQAALGLMQLERMPEMQARRMEIVQVYDRAFAAMPELTLQSNPPYSGHSKHLYVLRLTPGALRIDRDQFIQELNARNVGVSVHFIPVHLMSAYRQRFGYKEGDFPRAEAFFNQEISLPMYSGLAKADAAYVVEAVRDIVARHRA